jgi:hypothetical protein
MVTRDERRDSRLRIGLAVIGTDRRIEGDQRGRAPLIGQPMDLDVLRIGQKLLQQDDMAKRLADERRERVLDRHTGCVGPEVRRRMWRRMP